MNSFTQNRNHRAGGLVLLTIGLVLLAAEVFGAGWLVLPLLAITFLAAGVATRESGWFIPAGILGGLSAAIWLANGPYNIAEGDAQGGVFMLAFAAGWASIPVLSRLFTRDSHLWALIPAAVMGLIGAGVLGIGIFAQALELLPYVWPVALIGAGLYILLRRRNATTEPQG